MLACATEARQLSGLEVLDGVGGSWPRASEGVLVVAFLHGFIGRLGKEPPRWFTLNMFVLVLFRGEDDMMIVRVRWIGSGKETGKDRRPDQVISSSFNASYRDFLNHGSFFSTTTL